MAGFVGMQFEAENKQGMRKDQLEINFLLLLLINVWL